MKRAGKLSITVFGFLFVFSAWVAAAHANGKTTIAVMDFQGQDKNLTFLVTETFLTDLSMSGELEIVERNQIDKALDEIKKGQSGYIAVSDAVEAGKMAGAKKIIVGSFFEVEGKIIINARMLDVQTAKIDKALNKEGTKNELTKTIHVLANEFHKILTSQSITGLIPEEKIVNEWQKPPDTTNKPPDTSYVPPSSDYGGEVLLSDDFSYYTGSLIENEICKIKSGKYVMDYQKDEGKLYWSWTGESFSDFTYSIKATKISGPDKWGYGLIFRVQDVDNGYEFAVSGLGDYYVGKVEGGTYQDILKWTVNNAINKGNATNILQITAKGNTLSFYVNGTLLTTVTDSTFSSGRVGTLAYAQVLTEFDDLKVEGAATAPPTSYTPISTNISSKSSYDDFSAVNLFPDNSKVCSSRYEKGEYVFRYTEKGSCYVWILDDYSDFTISVKARKMKGKDLQGYGVIFRLDEQNNSYYDFIVSGNGDYSIGKFINGEFTELTPWTIHSSINKGNATNFIRVEAKGDMLNFSVNGVLVKTIYDGSLKTGKIGIKSFNEVETAFDDFKVESQ